MKKYLLFAATICVMTLGLISCEKKEEVSYSIVGTWELVSEEMLEYVNGELVNKYFDDEGGIWVSFNNDGHFLQKKTMEMRFMKILEIINMRMGN